MSTEPTMTEHTDADDDDSGGRTPAQQLQALIDAEPTGRPVNGAKPLNRVLFAVGTPFLKDPTTEAFREKLRGKAKASK